MKTLSRLILTLLLAICLSSPALAYTCNNDNPRSSEIWSAFTTFVRDNYLRRAAENSLGYRQYAFGHAAGRLGLAVQGDAEKKQALECVLFGIGQEFGIAVIATGDDRVARQAIEASMGMHNDIVFRVFGVTDTSPIDSVFYDALRLAGRTSTNPSYGQSTNYYGVPITGGNQTTVSSTAPRQAGTNTQCTSGDRWSLAQADAAFARARNLSLSLNGNCTGANRNRCRNIADNLYVARDHLFQTADQNHDGIAACKLCNYDRVIQNAQRLVTWQEWLGNNYYNASGLNNIYYTIQDMNRDPICKINKPIPPVTGGGFPPPPIYDDPPTPLRRADRFPPINSSTWSLADTKITGKKNTAISGCRHEPGIIKWSKSGRGGAQITYNHPPKILSPGENFTINAKGNVNITKDYARYPGFELVVSGKHIGNSSTVISMGKSNTDKGLNYSMNGKKSHQGPKIYNSIDEFEVTMSDDWCPKVHFVYRKGR